MPLQDYMKLVSVDDHAIEPADVDKLVAFMNDFASKHG